MQNRYVGDETDFLKYALLKRICMQIEGSHLGICWYLTDPATVDGNNPQNDGERIEYLMNNANWRRQVDEALYSTLNNALVLNGNINHAARLVTTIENGRVFPDTTRYFHEQVPQNHVDRAAWHQRSLLHLEDANVIFLDPDNSASDFYAHNIRGGKWAAPHEVLEYVRASRTVICISHPPRQNRRQHHRNMMATLGQLPGLLCSVYLGNCGFHCLICHKHDTVQAALEQFVREGIEGGWGTCRYLDSNGMEINAGGDLAVDELPAEAVAFNDDQWHYQEPVIVNDEDGCFWKNRNPWLNPEIECDIAFLLMDEQRIVCVSFEPFENPGYRTGVKPIAHPDNRLRWQEISRGAANQNLRVYRGLVREYHT